MTKSARREDCRICGSKHLVLAIPLKNIPLSENFSKTAQDSLRAPRFPIDIYQCLECLHIQQIDFIHPEDLWKDYSYFSGRTPNMANHFKEESAEIIQTYGSHIAKRVLEIGSNDGSFLKEFKQDGWEVLGVDPANQPCAIAMSNDIPTINSSYSGHTNKDVELLLGIPGLILAYNVFAHMDNIREILKSVAHLLTEDSPSIFRFEVQYAKSMVDNDLVPSIFHEHINHYSLISLSRFLEQECLYMVDAKVCNDIQHGSLVITSAKKCHIDIFGQSENLFSLLLAEANSNSVYLQGLLDFKKRIDRKKTLICSLLSDVSQTNVTISAFGAARSASTIISQLDIGQFITVVYDDDENKHGKFISGEGLLVLNANELESDNPGAIIILAWVHSNHIVVRLSGYIGCGGKVITLFPDIVIHSIEGNQIIG